jgi:conserved oligomeric Golgi complex subunit 6
MQSAESSANIYLINCLSAIQEKMDQEAATSYVNNLHSMTEAHIYALVQKEADSILTKCGLLDKMPYIKDYGSKDDAPLADVVETSSQMLLECLKAFYGLVTGTEGSLPEFEQLQVPRLRSDACYGLARALAETYELIYKAVIDPKNSYPDPRSLVKHSPEQIRTILEI